jgi:hypothetical protein
MDAAQPVPSNHNFQKALVKCKLSPLTWYQANRHTEHYTICGPKDADYQVTPNQEIDTGTTS